MGRFGSDIDRLSQEFDCEVSFARSSATDRVTEGQDAVELWIPESGFGRSLVEGSEGNATNFSLCRRPDHGRFILLQKCDLSGAADAPVGTPRTIEPLAGGKA